MALLVKRTLLFWLRGIFFFIPVILICISCSMAQPISERKLKGQVYAPEFPSQKEWLNTKSPIRLEQLKGKIVLLDFWTYCCINCHHVFPDLARLEEEFPNELVVIGVHSAKFTTEQETNNIREAILRHNIKHPVVNDNDFSIWRSYGISSWPSFALINAYGKLVGITSGEGIYETITPYIKALIDFHEKDASLDRVPVNFELEKSKEQKTILAFPGKIIADKKNNLLYVSDTNHHRIIILNEQGVIIDYIGSGISGLKNEDWKEARFNQPQGLVLNGAKLYIADTENHAIRVADLKLRKVTTLIGTGKQARQFNQAGVGTQVAINSPWDLGVYKDHLYVAMAGFHQIWKVNIVSGEGEPYAGSGREDILDHTGTHAQLAQPSGIAIWDYTLFFTDSETSSIRQVDLTTSYVKTLIGSGLFDFGDKDGYLKDAQLQHPLGIATSGQKVFIADTYNNKIKVIDKESKTIITLAGSGADGWKDGIATNAAFNEPGGVALLNGWLYIADTNNHLIRRINIQTGETRTLSLSNIDVLNMENFIEPIDKEEVKTLSKIMIPGSGSKLTVNIKLPGGYKFTEGAPNKLIFSSEDGLLFNQKSKEEVDPSQTNKTGVLLLSKPHHILDIVGYLYYCEEKRSQKCFFKNLHYKVPVGRDNNIETFPTIVLNVE